MPAVMRIEDKTLNIHDFWNRTDEKSDDSDGGIRAVGADPNLSHRADRILSQGWKPTLRWSAVDKCSS